MHSDRISLRARWIIPVEGDPIENGTVEFEEGVITAVHSAHDPTAIDLAEVLAEVAIIPGLVNAHTHLEFSALNEPLQPPQPFTAWIHSLISHRRKPYSGTSPIFMGLSESLLSGTTTCGEIATADRDPDVELLQNPRYVFFRELLARYPVDAEDQYRIAREFLERWRGVASATATPSSRFIPGLSPHAPYSVHPDLFRRLIDLAVEFRAPAAVHIAETRAELEFLGSGTGDFRRLYEDLGIWREGSVPCPLRPLDYLREMERLETGLVVHGNYLDDEDIAFLADRPQLSVVYCPRTHRFFGHENHPWQQLMEVGIRVALGTDSRASNPDLSLWNEMRFLHQQFPEIDPRVLLRMGTIDGAKALGIEKLTGSIVPGKAADFAMVSVDGISGTDPYVGLFDRECCALRVRNARPDYS